MYSKGRVDEPIGQRGFLCGAFLPSNHPLYSANLEVAWMELNSSTKGEKHFHKEVDEFTILIKGYLEEEVDGEIVRLRPGEFVLVRAGSTTQFKGAEDGTVAISIKAPSLPGDKQLVR